MVKTHGLEKPFSCDLCGKKFYLKWRLKKHANVHEEHTSKCKYFESREACPYNEIGCKFKHEEEGRSDEDEETVDDMETADDEHSVQNVDSFCCYCNTWFKTQQELIDHMGDNHMEHFTHIHEAQDLM